MDKVSQSDWLLTPVDPDPDFSPEHNQAVIDETIRKSKLMAARKQKEANDGVRERSKAISHYVKDVASGRTKSSVEKYFGNQELARLRGKEILDRIRYTDLGDEIKNKLNNAIKNSKLISENRYAE